MNLEWASAEVSDAKLTVELAGDMPKGWKQSFERTVALLGDGEWGEIQLKKSTVRVSDVTPGTEDKLRHHLEAVVTQANADHEVNDDEDRGDDDESEGPDAEMTDRFRGIAEDDDEDEDAD